MKYLVTIFLFVISCKSPDETEKPRFDQMVWLANPEMQYINNPRAKMTADLLKNWLKPGITKDSIFTLLGKPYMDTITHRLPKGLSTPDSLKTYNFIGESRPVRDSILEAYNIWYFENAQLDTLLLYPVGWSLVDPNFLVIKLSPDNIGYEFWVEQH